MRKLNLWEKNNKQATAHPGYKKNDAYYQLSCEDLVTSFRPVAFQNRRRYNIFNNLKIGPNRHMAHAALVR